jgi:hypothetical protein
MFLEKEEVGLRVADILKNCTSSLPEIFSLAI